MRKAIIPCILSLMLALGIVYGLPMLMKDDGHIDAEIINETSLVNQEILSYEKTETE